MYNLSFNSSSTSNHSDDTSCFLFLLLSFFFCFFLRFSLFLSLLTPSLISTLPNTLYIIIVMKCYEGKRKNVSRKFSIKSSLFLLEEKIEGEKERDKKTRTGIWEKNEGRRMREKRNEMFMHIRKWPLFLFYI